MKKIIKKIMYLISVKFILKNYIIFESNPDYCDNSYYVYKELINQKYNEKYKLVWFVRNKKKFEDIRIKNVVFVKKGSLQEKYYKLFAKFIIDCNLFVDKLNKYQYRFYLGHGMVIKEVPEYIGNCGEVNNFLLTSDFFKDYNIKVTGLKKETFLSLGYPRCDQFYMKKVEFTEFSKYTKKIIWMPTFRKHQEQKNGIGYKYKYGVPCIANKKELNELNTLLKKNNTVLIIKLHPAEDISSIDKEEVSNIYFTKNDLFENNHKNIYHLLQNTDALITDYSSVYYDYLLLNKPIGMAVADIDEFKQKYKLFYNDLEKNLPGEYIYTYEDLLDFINHVIQDKDTKKAERLEALNKYFKYNDGNASKRVVAILKENGLK